MNHFNDLIQSVGQTPPPQRADALIDGIGKVLQAQSGHESPEELCQELQAAKLQLVKAFNQTQGQSPR